MTVEFIYFFYLGCARLDRPTEVPTLAERASSDLLPIPPTPHFHTIRSCQQTSNPKGDARQVREKFR